MSNPFPMPEPQRTAAVAIIQAVAAAHRLPPGFLTTHIDGRPDVVVAREEAQRRIMREVPGMDHSMLARAWGRDVRRIRALMNNPESRQMILAAKQRILEANAIDDESPPREKP